MIAELTREPWQPSNLETLGWLRVHGVTLCTIELPWQDNRPRASCIPPGLYQVSFVPVSASGKYSNVYLVDGVPGRSEIMIHPANLASELMGCIAVGLRHGVYRGQRAVFDSRMGLDKLNDLTGTDPFELRISYLE
jgi:hypothetical protein